MSSIAKKNSLFQIQKKTLNWHQLSKTNYAEFDVKILNYTEKEVRCAQKLQTPLSPYYSNKFHFSFQLSPSPVTASMRTKLLYKFGHRC